MHFTFAGNTGLLLSGAFDKQVKAWDCIDFREVASHARHRSAVTAVACNNDGTRAATGDQSGNVFTWTMENSRTADRFAAFDGRVNALAYSPGGEFLACGGGTEREDSLIHLWDSRSGNLIRTLQGHSDWVLWVGFSASGALMASGSYGEICLWDTGTWKLLQILKPPAKESFSTIAFSFSSDNEVFISGAWSHEEFKQEVHDGSGNLVGWNVTRKGLMQLWDLKSGKLNDVIEAHDDSLCCLAHNRRTDLIATGSAGGVVKIWSLESAAQPNLP